MKDNIYRISLFFFLFFIIFSFSASAATQPRPLSCEEVLADLVRNADSTWRRVTTPGGRYGCRSLFTSMLAYTEADTHSDRVAILIEKAEAMQERDPENLRYGNFFWYAWESEVHDANAVDFCMQHAALLWMFHQKKLDPQTRERFFRMITLGLQGLINHHPPPTYTNIALLNASDLILLGQALDNPEAVEEGIRRLEMFLVTIREQGIHEYCSPTYYGINMESALLLEALAKDPVTKQNAAVIRRLLEHDIALNRLSAHDVLAGPCSRTYDFLYRQGELEQVLVANGWLKRPLPKNRRRFYFRFFSSLYTDHLPPPETTALTAIFPRSVKQRWGFTTRTTRTHYLCKDVALGSSASIYGRMDIPLAVTLPDSGELLEPQLYFLPDGRNDPYGKKRIIAGNHNKALHLTPWWTAAQHENSALAMVLYDPKTFKHISDKLQSHIVFRKALDGLYIDDRRVDPASLSSEPEKLNPGQTLFLREGTAAVAIQVPWAQGQDGSGVSTSLIDDNSKYESLRLSVDHTIKSLEEDSSLTCAGAVFKIQTGSNIRNDSDFEHFRKHFCAQSVDISHAGESLKASIKHGDKILAIRADSLINPEVAEITPQPSTALLSLDGKDIGRAILEESPVVREYINRKISAKPITVDTERPTTWFASDGSYTVPLQEAESSGKIYLWVPEKKGRRNWSAGTASWELVLSSPGSFYLEAEVLAPTPEDDSFYVSALGSADNEVISEFAWSTGVDTNWRWSRVINRDSKPYKNLFQLPAGRSRLIFRTREAGTKVSRLRIIPRK